MITAEKFRLYEQVRQEGQTNMLDIGRVVEEVYYSLTREEVREIQDRYSELKELYSGGE